MVSLNRVLSTIVAASMLFAVGASAQEVKHYRFAYDQPKTTGYGILGDIFADKLKELSKGTMDRQWPHQVALPADNCTGHNYVTIRLFCEGLTAPGRTSRRRRVHCTVFGSMLGRSRSAFSGCVRLAQLLDRLAVCSPTRRQTRSHRRSPSGRIDSL